MMALTTIQIRKDTRDELKKIGRKDMFFNELSKIADSEEFVSLDEI